MHFHPVHTCIMGINLLKPPLSTEWGKIINETTVIFKHKHKNRIPRTPIEKQDFLCVSTNKLQPLASVNTSVWGPLLNKQIMTFNGIIKGAESLQERFNDGAAWALISLVANYLVASHRRLLTVSMGTLTPGPVLSALRMRVAVGAEVIGTDVCLDVCVVCVGTACRPCVMSV